MKTKFIKRGMSGLMAVLMAVTAFIGLGATTAFAASETAESYKEWGSVSEPAATTGKS